MSTILFRNVRLFDGVADEAPEGMNVLVVDGLIEAVSEKPIAVNGATVVEGGGRMMLPGLIDAHVHVFAVNLVASRNENMPLTEMTGRAVPRIRAMLDRGFTTVRDVGGGDVGIRDAVAQGFIAGPRLFVGGAALSQTGGHGDHRRRTDSRARVDRNASALEFFSQVVDGPEEMRRVVRRELAKGADHIKLMASGGIGSPTDSIDNIQFTDEEVQVAVFEARARASYVCAHTYTCEAIRHAVKNGVRTVEHANYIDGATAAFVKEQDAYVVPTLVCYEETEKHGDRLGLSKFVMEKLRLVNEAGIAMLEICEQAGARMGFGTDLMGELEYAQSDEFAIRGRVQRPADILRSATSMNAEILMQPGKLGVIAPGAHADLIVCDGDPLRDITLLARPAESLRLIMKAGAFHKNDLDTRQ